MVQIRLYCPHCDQAKRGTFEWYENAYLKLHIEGARRTCYTCNRPGLFVAILATVGKPLKA